MTKVEKEKKKSPLKAGCLVVLLIIVGIFIFEFLPAIKADKEYREKPIPYVTPEGTIERIVEEVAVGAFGKTVNWDNKPYTIKEIKKIKQTAGPDEGFYLVEIFYRTNDNLTVGLIKSGIFMDVIEFTKELFLPSFCEEIKIYMLKPYLILTDKYGKEREEQVAKLVLRRAISYKVNWENTTNEMFKRLLINEGQLWVHPALSK